MLAEIQLEIGLILRIHYIVIKFESNFFQMILIGGSIFCVFLNIRASINIIKIYECYHL